jgi:hypothetical protein
MARLPLIGGAYSSRSVLSNAQRAINYFPEINRRDSPTPMTHYQRPGFVPLVAAAGKSVVRCIYQASNGASYACVGDTIYSVDSSFVLTALGTITPGRTNPVSMIDNGTRVSIVDGSTNSWEILLATNAFSLHNDPSGNFAGGTRVDTLDTFVVWNKPGTKFYGSTFSNSLDSNGLSFGSKATYPDPIQTLIIRRTEIILLGTLKGEIHYNVGGALFPFARLPGAYIEYGCSAPYSVAAIDICTFWLHRSLEGKALILKLKGYDVTAISNPALSNAIEAMTDASDAIGFCYTQNGHVFYEIVFPSADQSWVYDESIADPQLAWHQRCWTDSNGILHRDRSNCFGFINNVACVGDWQNGTIYKLDPNTYTDTVAGIEGPISFIRSFPHVTQGYDAKGELVDTDGKSLTFRQFRAQIECGNAPLDINLQPAKIGLRWSDDYGRTWGQTILQSDGGLGEYATDPSWPGLGTAKHRVFELSHSIAAQAALNGAWIDAVVNAI